jgi:hypothetical protein
VVAASGRFEELQTDAEELTCTKWAAQRYIENGVTCDHDNFATKEAAATYIRLERSGDLLKVAMANPLDVQAVDDIAKAQELLKSGAITQPEFEAMKAKALA